jgi:EipB-like
MSSLIGPCHASRRAQLRLVTRVPIFPGKSEKAHLMIRKAGFLLGAVTFATAGFSPSVFAASDGLAAHRAVYDLKLVQTRGKATIQAVRGRILYDFSGNSCEGYALQFRQVSELDTGEGRIAVSDLRSTTWEDGDARSFRFNSQNFLNQELGDDVDGRAERRSDGVSVNLTKPRGKALTLDAATVFPSEHMRRILAAAREGKTILELPVYDGSETGEKIYNTLTVIGQAIAPDQRKPTDAAADQAGLAGLKRWPVTISYFERNTKGGEQTPVYAIAFETYENGISRALTLDYNDFVISGEMSALEIRDAKSCP